MHKRSIGINNYNITQKCERKKYIYIYIYKNKNRSLLFTYMHKKESIHFLP